ncbi:MAG: POTRA domain-containing protein, partial [Nitrospirota bacterium]
MAETLSSDLNLNESRATMNSAIEQQGSPESCRLSGAESSRPAVNKKYCSSALLLFCAAALLICLLSSSSIEASDTVIQKINIEGLHSMKSEELLDILSIKIGDVFNPPAVRAGLKLAFLKGIFED